MIVLRLVDVGGFDGLSVNYIEELVTTSDFQHVLDNTVISLFQFLDNISDLILVMHIPGSVKFEFLDEFKPLVNINFSYLAEHLESLLIDIDCLKKDI